ncbi:hypothetical protein J2752_002817 [Halarchaeum rubridurum]|uniref:DUF447 family protein n=1 Tax=Halarchaeum rubridurum TaxID=489911 RepID=A0A830G5B1_9EURY|nr:DUF447 domain-containing protein [Halarchaeum rubridurum]MBP1955886.1 hypothetical protein [Halarchaeum rubridurum]GGM75113.1 hypothetical protein GCM10009017_26320 [Halarchaeum rubridurum]
MTDWPVPLRGVTESIITTEGPNGRWNAAALGLHAGDVVTAETWGHTRTRRNFERTGVGYVHFTRDARLFVEAALGVHETDESALPSADARVRVDVERREAGKRDGTPWASWALHPTAVAVGEERVPLTNRGFAAVVEATVAASRLGVEAYDDDVLRRRLDHATAVARRCGGPAEHDAIDRVHEHVEEAQSDG